MSNTYQIGELILVTLQHAVDVLAASIRVCGGVLQGGEVALLNALL